MSKRKPEEPKAGAAEWLGTYGDMVTLLLCFFVLLYSMSTLDVEKFQAISASISGNPVTIITVESSSGVNGLLGSGILEMPRDRSSQQQDSEGQQKAEREARDELKKMASDFKTYFAQYNLQEKITVQNEEDYIWLRFADGILFDVGKANLRPEVIPILDLVSDELQKYSDNDIRIEGHTDNDPINVPLYPNNLYLSAARSISVMLFFIEDKGLDPTRFAAEGMGEYRPLVPNDSAENKAKNRRVEIKIMRRQLDGESD